MQLWMHRLCSYEVPSEGQHCAEPQAHPLAWDLPDLLTKKCPMDSPAPSESCWKPCRALQERLRTCISAWLNRTNNGNHHLMVLKMTVQLLEAKFTGVRVTCDPQHSRETSNTAYQPQVHLPCQISLLLPLLQSQQSW